MSKLNDAKQLVDELKRKANEQSQLLAEKQAEADAALREITVSMQVCPGQSLPSMNIIEGYHHQHAGMFWSVLASC